ncbi:hypothetical protein D3C85_1603270 [compost metagenome]
MMLERWSKATSWPISLDNCTLLRNCASDAGLASNLSGITGPPSSPSSVTETQRVAGVHSDFIYTRSTPGSKKIRSLMDCKVRR